MLRYWNFKKNKSKNKVYFHLGLEVFFFLKESFENICFAFSHRSADKQWSSIIADGPVTMQTQAEWIG